MAEIALPAIVTAIANAETEGFIARTLFAQGWSVIYRAVDEASLRYFLDDLANREVLLIFSPDLLGLTPSAVLDFQKRVRQVVGFAADPSNFKEYSGLLLTPKEPAELLSCIRGFVRAPLLRAPETSPFKNKRARVIAIASPSGATGCTTVAINLAMELSALEKETLLMDADVRSPAVATLLGLHKLDRDEFARPIATHLKASEFSQSRVETLPAYLDYVSTNFDYVVIDLGSIDEMSDSLTDRRWTASLVHWSCEQAEEIIFVGKADPLSLHRFGTLSKSLANLTIHAKLSFLLNMRVAGRKGAAQETQFFSHISAFRAHRKVILPKDAPAVLKAEVERATLIEINEKSALRREIAKLAASLQS